MKLIEAREKSLRCRLAIRREAILAIRKAFTFEDVHPDAEIPAIGDSGSFGCTVLEGYGFGLAAKKGSNWIAARIDEVNNNIIVTTCLESVKSKAFYALDLTSDHYGLADITNEIRQRVIDFLVQVALHYTPIEW